jgi:hypothetical protein
VNEVHGLGGGEVVKEALKLGYVAGDATVVSEARVTVGQHMAQAGLKRIAYEAQVILEDPKELGAGVILHRPDPNVPRRAIHENRGAYKAVHIREELPGEVEASAYARRR